MSTQFIQPITNEVLQKFPLGCVPPRVERALRKRWQALAAKTPVADPGTGFEVIVFANLFGCCRVFRSHVVCCTDGLVLADPQLVSEVEQAADKIMQRLKAIAHARDHTPDFAYVSIRSTVQYVIIASADLIP